MELHKGSLARARASLESRERSSRELIDQALEAATGAGLRLNLIVGTRDEAARAEAEAADARYAKGDALSPLDGLPIVLKDNMVMKGEPTQCASRILEGFVSPYSSTAAEKLRAAGAIVIGRANMDEFAMGSSTEHSVFGAAHNPWDETRSCGGSSGGSAAAVAAEIVPGSLGSDTGGSIRQPASFCGVVGMKPTYGRVSRWGLVAFASSLDQIGPFAHTADDCASLLQVICGHDPRDSTSLPEAVPDFRAALSGDVSGLRIGLPKEYFDLPGVEPEVLARVQEGVDALVAAGAVVTEVSLPHTPFAIATYYLIATAEASSNLARFDGARYGHRAERPRGLADMYERTRSEGFGDEVKRRILLGTYVLSAGYYDAYYLKAQKVRTLLRRDLENAFEHCDVIASPTYPETAFPLGAKQEDALRMYLGDVFTVTCNLAGTPGISLPCGFSEGRPVGLQLLGRALDEATLLRVGDAFQRTTDHHRAAPPCVGSTS